MQLPDHARRALRTLYQAVLAMVTIVPAFLAALPAGSPLAVKLGGIAASVAAVSGVVNKLEDDGILGVQIPALLKGVTEGDAPAVDPAA